MRSARESEPGTGEQLRSLQEAIETGKLGLVFQPKFDLLTGALQGAEALIRWHPGTPVACWQCPDRFVCLAEDNDLSGALDLHVLESVLRATGKWAASTRMSLGPISVNISASSVQMPDFEHTVKQIIAPASQPKLIFELTETAPITDPFQARETLLNLADYGIELSLDDFLTGYNQISYLRLLPVAEIKIDRSDIANLDTEKGRHKVKYILALAQAANLKVTAEGIETTRQYETLRDLGCHFGQGYWFSPALPSDALESFVESYTPDSFRTTSEVASEYSHFHIKA